MIVFINANGPRPQVKVRARGIVGGKDGIFDPVDVGRSLGHILSPEKVRVILRPGIAGADLLGVDVVNTAFSDIEVDVPVDADVPFHRNFVRVRIVAGVVSINIGVADVNRDIVSRRRYAVLVSSFSA